jgi:hypothetical protein
MKNWDDVADYIVDLMQENVNPPSTAPKIGEVVETNPLKIKWGDSIIINEDKLFLPKVYKSGHDFEIPNRYQDTNGNMINEEIDWNMKITLSVGDKVIIVPDEHYKMFYLVDVL